MDGWMDGWMDEWMDEWVDGWGCEWINGWMDGPMQRMCPQRKYSDATGAKESSSKSNSSSEPLLVE